MAYSCQLTSKQNDYVRIYVPDPNSPFNNNDNFFHVGYGRGNSITGSSPYNAKNINKDQFWYVRWKRTDGKSTYSDNGSVTDTNIFNQAIVSRYVTTAPANMNYEILGYCIGSVNGTGIGLKGEIISNIHTRISSVVISGSNVRITIPTVYLPSGTKMAIVGSSTEYSGSISGSNTVYTLPFSGNSVDYDFRSMPTSISVGESKKADAQENYQTASLVTSTINVQRVQRDTPTNVNIQFGELYLQPIITWKNDKKGSYTVTATLPDGSSKIKKIEANSNDTCSVSFDNGDYLNGSGAIKIEADGSDTAVYQGYSGTSYSDDTGNYSYSFGTATFEATSQASYTRNVTGPQYNAPTISEVYDYEFPEQYLSYSRPDIRVFRLASPNSEEIRKEETFHYQIGNSDIVDVPYGQNDNYVYIEAPTTGTYTISVWSTYHNLYETSKNSLRKNYSSIPLGMIGFSKNGYNSALVLVQPTQSQSFPGYVYDGEMISCNIYLNNILKYSTVINKNNKKNFSTTISGFLPNQSNLIRLD